MDTLQVQIDKAARTIDTDSYSVSVGELMSMYESDEIDVHPEFQRAFRWEIGQKSTLIESLLLGIPIPPIFVFTRASDSVWDIIDGQQRLSTIFQFAGIYRDKDGKREDGIRLTKTKFLPLLDGIVWESEDENCYQLSRAQRILIKRAKIDVKILKSTSDKDSKYDLFQRLNAGGTRLSPQEIRTCIIIMENEEFYDELLEFCKNENFKACLPLTERAINEQENLEFVVRFIVSRHGNLAEIGQSLHDYLTESIVNIIRNPGFSLSDEKKVFDELFEYLNQCVGESTFKRYNVDKESFQGPPTISAFEAIIPAVSKRLALYLKTPHDEFKSKIISLHKHSQYKTVYQRRSTDRYKALMMIGEEIFGQNES